MAPRGAAADVECPVTDIYRRTPSSGRYWHDSPPPAFYLLHLNAPTWEEPNVWHYVNAASLHNRYTWVGAKQESTSIMRNGCHVPRLSCSSFLCVVFNHPPGRHFWASHCMPSMHGRVNIWQTYGRGLISNVTLSCVLMLHGHTHLLLVDWLSFLFFWS